MIVFQSLTLSRNLLVYLTKNLNGLESKNSLYTTIKANKFSAKNTKPSLRTVKRVCGPTWARTRDQKIMSLYDNQNKRLILSYLYI